MLDEQARLEVLGALGIDVYRLREAFPAPAVVEAPLAQRGDDTRAPEPEAVSTAARADLRESVESAPVAVRLAVACSSVARASGTVDRIVRALGIAPRAVAWIDPASAAELPPVDAFLLVGDGAARCAAALPIERQNAATIVVCPEPAVALASAASRRALWQALKPLARRLAAG